VHGIRRDGPSSGPLHGGVTIGRLMAGVDYSRPLRPKWSGTAGISFQRAGARDEHGQPKVVDVNGGPLTFSGQAYDDMLVAKLETVYMDSGDNGSSQLVFNTEQGLPLAKNWLFFNRINVRARQGLRVGPVRCIARLVDSVHCVVCAGISWRQHLFFF
jgi:outer membrane protein insertion porin family